jgi:hypothetical protein
MGNEIPQGIKIMLCRRSDDKGAQNPPIGTMGRLHRITTKKEKRGEEGKS